jgi:hypothetical protein
VIGDESDAQAGGANNNNNTATVNGDGFSALAQAPNGCTATAPPDANCS